MLNIPGLLIPMLSNSKDEIRFHVAFRYPGPSPSGSWPQCELFYGNAMDNVARIVTNMYPLLRVILMHCSHSILKTNWPHQLYSIQNSIFRISFSYTRQVDSPHLGTRFSERNTTYRTSYSSRCSICDEYLYLPELGFGSFLQTLGRSNQSGEMVYSWSHHDNELQQRFSLSFACK